MCDPEITVAIFSVTRPIAAKFLHQIKAGLSSNLAAAIEQPWVFCVLAPEQDGQWEIAIVAAEQRKFAGQR